MTVYIKGSITSIAPSPPPSPVRKPLSPDLRSQEQVNSQDSTEAPNPYWHDVKQPRPERPLSPVNSLSQASPKATPPGVIMGIRKDKKRQYSQDPTEAPIPLEHAREQSSSDPPPSALTSLSLTPPKAAPPVVIISDDEKPEPKPRPQKRPYWVQATLFNPKQQTLDIEFLETIRDLFSERAMTEIQQRAAHTLEGTPQRRGYMIHTVAETLRKELERYKPITLKLTNGHRLSSTVAEFVYSIFFTQCPSLTEFPPSLPFFGRLLKLHFRETSLTALPDALGECITLNELQIVKHQLTEISPQIGRLTNLTLLTIKRGLLKEVPRELSNCTALLSLDLSKNQIEKLSLLPPDFLALFRLTSLNLNFNELSGWPLFWVLRNLKNLNMSRNLIKNVPATIRNMTTLQEIRLKFCGITEITPYIIDLTRLTKLDLSLNELKALPPQLGQSLSLAHLNVAHNQLSRLPSLKNLTFLNISCNPIIPVDPKWKPVNPQCQVVWEPFSEKDLQDSDQD